MRLAVNVLRNPIDLENYDIIEGKIDENNFKKTMEFINEENLFKNNNNDQRSYDKLKYEVIENENIYNDNFKGNEQILLNDGNLIRNMKNKEYNDDFNYEDIEKQRICENSGENEQFYEENADKKKRYYNDANVYVQKIDRSETEEIKLLQCTKLILTLNLPTVLVYLFLPSSVKLTVNKKDLSILLFNFLEKEKTKLEVKSEENFICIF